MRYAVISDVHGNIEALQAVLEDIKNKKIENILFLGDAVGYGPDPEECVKTLFYSCQILLAGNHDWAVLDLTDIDYFNPHAKAAILWTKENLSEEALSMLRRFEISREVENKKIFLVHSTPKNPTEWNYLLTLWDAEINFHYFDNPICLIGHSHYPFIIERLPSGEMITHREKAKLDSSKRYIINVGSVGQPRDGDPRACYSVIDEWWVRFYRVEYDVKKTQKKMKAYGLPQSLIKRLQHGL